MVRSWFDCANNVLAVDVLLIVLAYQGRELGGNGVCTCVAHTVGLGVGRSSVSSILHNSTCIKHLFYGANATTEYSVYPLQNKFVWTNHAVYAALQPITNYQPMTWCNNPWTDFRSFPPKPLSACTVALGRSTEGGPDIVCPRMTLE